MHDNNIQTRASSIEKSIAILSILRYYRYRDTRKFWYRYRIEVSKTSVSEVSVSGYWLNWYRYRYRSIEQFSIEVSVSRYLNPSGTRYRYRNTERIYKYTRLISLAGF